MRRLLIPGRHPKPSQSKSSSGAPKNMRAMGWPCQEIWRLLNCSRRTMRMFAAAHPVMRQLRDQYYLCWTDETSGGEERWIKDDQNIGRTLARPPQPLVLWMMFRHDDVEEDLEVEAEKIEGTLDEDRWEDLEKVEPKDAMTRMAETLGPMHAGVIERYKDAIAALTAEVQAWRERLNIIVTHAQQSDEEIGELRSRLNEAAVNEKEMSSIPSEQMGRMSRLQRKKTELAGDLTEIKVRHEAVRAEMKAQYDAQFSIMKQAIDELCAEREQQQPQDELEDNEEGNGKETITLILYFTAHSDAAGLEVAEDINVHDIYKEVRRRLRLEWMATGDIANTDQETRAIVPIRTEDDLEEALVWRGENGEVELNFKQPYRVYHAEQNGARAEILVVETWENLGFGVSQGEYSSPELSSPPSSRGGW